MRGLRASRVSAWTVPAALAVCAVRPERAAAAANPSPFVVDSMRTSGEIASIADSDGGNFHGRVPYNGGPIIDSARVVAVFWGSDVDRTVVAGVGGFYQALTGGGMMHFLSEYSTTTQSLGAYATFVGSFAIVPLHGGAAITDADVQSELTQQIALGSLPAADANTIYMIHFPPGVAVTGPLSTGVSCVDFCGYHYAGGGVIYAILPDQSGGCAPGPPGCNTSTTARCCGDRTAFQNLTKTASHELMEAITDPLSTDLAWQDVLGGAGEVADPCNFSRVGDDAYTPVVGADGTLYEGQKGFSDAAYLAGVGAFRGCVDYPTTMCCAIDAPNADGAASQPASCAWRSPAVAACPVVAGQIVVSLATRGGEGSASLGVVRAAPFSGVCFPSGATSRRPEFCVELQSTGVVEEGVATVSMAVDSTHPNAELCLGAPLAGNCPAGTSVVRGSCCGPLVPFVVSGSIQSIDTTVPGVPLPVTPVPAVPPARIGLFGLLFLGLGAGTSSRGLARRRRPRARPSCQVDRETRR
jgi:hypothetical protein